MSSNTKDNSGKLFISHSSQDDDFVRRLREALAPHGQDAWVDSRELRGGDPLWSDIQAAIEASSAFAVVVSTDSLQSKWVGKELQYALSIQQQRGRENFQVIPVSLNDTKLGVLESFFAEEPTYISVSDEAGGLEIALDKILVALGLRLGADIEEIPQPEAEPLEELVLELSQLKLTEKDGKQRASGEAKLVYIPATGERRKVESQQKWRFTAPLGPIEAGELKWYLEQFAIWPGEVFKNRAREVEENLERWGQLLYQTAMPGEHVTNVLEAWAAANKQAQRRFSVYVETTTVAGAVQQEVTDVKTAATQLLGLPWELLHNGREYLFQAKQPVRVRRRLPNTQDCDVAAVNPPIRILLITARPEDDACGYIDHRVSAEPLVTAMEALGSLVELTLLNPPTLPALREELERQKRKQQHYHVVHFDGHGVYNRTIGLGGLCFEHPEDAGKLGKRRHQTIYTKELGKLLNQHNIPLVFLEACQTAMSEEASESVASELLQRGIASVVAMSHSVLVETAKRFVKEFYGKLTEGARIGEAMLTGQHALKDNSFRGNVFGAGELRLSDWFVPVLFQEQADPQLFIKTLKPQAQEDVKQALEIQLKKLPEPPPIEFIGRSRELLALERLLHNHPYAIVVGQGGEGKTALAAEFARWQLRARQVRQVVFVSVEQHQHVSAVLDNIGQQLLNQYSVAEFESLEQARLPVERALREQATLLIIDNMESILLPPYLLGTTPDALQEENKKELDAILALCEQLNSTGKTRIILTSRECLPDPFHHNRQQISLQQLQQSDAVKLVERTLNSSTDNNTDSAITDAAERADIEDLVTAVNRHARSLTLLAPSLQSIGVKQTTQKLEALMADMQGSREQSLYASLELSLERLSPENRERVRVLGLFQGGVQLGVLQTMMDWQQDDITSLVDDLLATGLATANPYAHLSLNAALCPYLLRELQLAEPDNTLDESPLQALKARWRAAMVAYVSFVEQQYRQDTQMAVTLTRLELPNLFFLLEQMAQQEQAETIIAVCTDLYGLLQYLGKPRLLARIASVRDTAENALGDTWSRARFQAQRIRIEQQLNQGLLQAAFDCAKQLLAQTHSAGETAYGGANYDLAMAHFLLARVMKTGGNAEAAVALQEEAFRRFEAMATEQESHAATRMASVCLAEKGDSLVEMGRYNEAVDAYEENIERAEKLEDKRQIAVGKMQLGTVRLEQKNYQDALEAYTEAREGFEQLGEPGSVAVAWHQTGRVYEENRQPEVAEDAYRKSLAIEVQQGNLAGQARTQGQLSSLYDIQLGRTEEAVDLLRQAVDKYIEVGDIKHEGMSYSNLAICLHKLKRTDEARQAIGRAIECKSQLGHTARTWMSWATLKNIEIDDGNTAAAKKAQQQAFKCYLAYRQGGGEDHSDAGRLAYDITQMLLAEEFEQAETLLQEIETQLHEAGYGIYHNALLEIVKGSRDSSLAEHPELSYDLATEIVILLEALQSSESE